MFWNDRFKPWIESAINLISSIILIRYYGFRGKTNKIQKITSGEALPLILPQTLFYGDEEETNLLLSFLDRFLQSVPVYKMECTMEEEAAKTAYFCMKGEEK